MDDDFTQKFHRLSYMLGHGSAFQRTIDKSLAPRGILHSNPDFANIIRSFAKTVADIKYAFRRALEQRRYGLVQDLLNFNVDRTGLFCNLTLELAAMEAASELKVKNQAADVMSFRAFVFCRAVSSVLVLAKQTWRTKTHNLEDLLMTGLQSVDDSADPVPGFLNRVLVGVYRLSVIVDKNQLVELITCCLDTACFNVAVCLILGRQQHDWEWLRSVLKMDKVLDEIHVKILFEIANVNLRFFSSV